MLKAYKYELRPTDSQKIQLTQAMNACRFVYNLALETKINAYRHGKNLSAYDLMKQLTDLKKEATWLKDVLNASLQHAIFDLDRAYSNFFRGNTKFPRFHKKSGKQSYRIPEPVKVNFDKWEVVLPKYGAVSLNKDRVFTGVSKQATVCKTPTGRYFISILVDTGMPIPAKQPIKEETAIGLDLGLKHLVALSDGRKINNPRFLQNSLKKLRIAQRSLARKKKGSKRREAQKLKVAKLHEKIANQRKDFLHKLSTEITNQYDAIAIESLNVQGMIKNHNLAKSISDASWSSFVTMLKYKADWYGKNILQIGRFEPSSKTCSCGVVNHDLKLHQREWVCESCGLVHDRDILAANNIKKMGLRTQPSVRQREAVACA
jgi:putative transposase